MFVVGVSGNSFASSELFEGKSINGVSPSSFSPAIYKTALTLLWLHNQLHTFGIMAGLKTIKLFLNECSNNVNRGDENVQLMNSHEKSMETDAKTLITVREEKPRCVTATLLHHCHNSSILRPNYLN